MLVPSLQSQKFDGGGGIMAKSGNRAPKCDIIILQTFPFKR